MPHPMSTPTAEGHHGALGRDHRADRRALAEVRVGHQGEVPGEDRQARGQRRLLARQVVELARPRQHVRRDPLRHASTVSDGLVSYPRRVAADDEIIRAYDDELGPEPMPRSNRRFWLVAGAMALGGIVLDRRDLREPEPREHDRTRPAHAATGAGRAPSRSGAAPAPTRRRTPTSSQDLPELAFREAGDASFGLDVVSVSASETTWAAAVRARPGRASTSGWSIGSDPRLRGSAAASARARRPRGRRHALVVGRAARRAIEELDRVDDLGGHAELVQAGAELHRATGVAGGDHGGAGRRDRLRLLAHQPCRHLRLGDVVDPRGAAAAIAVRGISTSSRFPIELSSSRGCRWIPCARRAWQASWYATRVGAGSDPGLAHALLEEEGHHVPDREARPLREVSVLRHVRAAPRGVHDDVVGSGEDRRVPPRELPRGPQMAVAARPAHRSTSAHRARPRATLPGRALGSSRC